MVDAQVHAVRHAAHLRRDTDRGGLGDPAGAGHEPGFVGGVSAWAAVMRVERGSSERLCWGGRGVAACVASAGVPARCGGPWARLGAWAPSLVCGGFIWKSYSVTCKPSAGAPSLLCGDHGV